jgi:PPM family protein phosphatase
MRIAVGAKTDIGLVREGNEDSYLVDDPLFAVADGMGGHLAGDVASSTAIDVISRRARETDLRDEEGLRAVVREANAAIWKRSQGDSALRGMGTTCTLLSLGNSQARLAHVGDSRAYLLRDGELSQLTEDHTLVGRMVREGRLTAEEAQNHPQRSIITRALGVDSEVDVDTLTLDLGEGDRLLICSDGLTSMVGTDVIARALTDEPDPQRAADRLVQLAIENGGEDNVTVLVLDVGEGPGSSRGGTAQTAARAPAIDPREARSTSEGTVMTAVRPETSAPEPETYRPGKPRRRWVRGLVGAVIVLGILTVGAYFLVRTLLDNSYFVGLDDEGFVTLYRGIPEEVFGVSLKKVEQHTDLAVDDLPEFRQDDVQAGMKSDSLADAEETLANLQELRTDEGPDRVRPREKKRD